MIEAFGARAKIDSDPISANTELLEVALSNLALADDFGDKFLKRKGTIDPDLDLEL